MVNLIIPGAPVSVVEWTEPVDSDLRFISMLCFMHIQAWEAAHNAAYRIRQLEESDGNTLVSEANSAISTLLSALSSAYESSEGDD